MIKKLIGSIIIITVIVLLVLSNFDTLRNSPSRVSGNIIFEGNDLVWSTPKVFIPQELMKELNEDFNIETEGAFCLMGKIEQDGYYITALEKPTEIATSKISYTYQINPCLQENFIGFLHTHPTGHTYPSEQDIFSWGKDNGLHNLSIQGIQNEKDSIQFYVMERDEDARKPFTEINYWVNEE